MGLDGSMFIIAESGRADPSGPLTPNSGGTGLISKSPFPMGLGIPVLGGDANGFMQ